MRYSKASLIELTNRGGTVVRPWALRCLLITLVTWFGGPTIISAQALSSGTGGSWDRSATQLVYVAEGFVDVSVLNTANNSRIARLSPFDQPFGIAISPNGRLAYTTLFTSPGNVRVFDTTTDVPIATIGVGNFPQGIAVTPDGAFLYVANTADNTVSVIATGTNTVLQTISVGASPVGVAMAPGGSRVYVSDQFDDTVKVIATASNTVIASVQIQDEPRRLAVSPDGRFVYVATGFVNGVAVIDTNSNNVVRNFVVGASPQDVAFTPDGLHAYVTNFDDNTVSVVDTATQTMTGTIPVGTNPQGLTVTPDGQFVYVGNFTDGTVSVISTASNTVTATKSVSPQPLALVATNRARPAILGYTFQAFDPPGSVDTIPRGINDLGQNVGSFQDGAGVVHGYLRQHDGSFVTIDPPGSTFSIAGGINDLGIIVGEWISADGIVHGFTRSPAGIYKTLDFPGAVDTGLAGINLQGTIVGAYDLGDQTTSIGFVDTRGLFTSFEDPAAAPMQTSASGINSLNFISGSYGDAAGSSHGFIRDPRAQFRNFDFPEATDTIGAKINDFGQVAGQYFANSPSHGLILNGATTLTGLAAPSQFLSFDYPDSQASALRGINDLRQVSGFYRRKGDPARHGFLAAPLATQSGDQNDQ